MTAIITAFLLLGIATTVSVTSADNVTTIASVLHGPNSQTLRIIKVTGRADKVVLYGRHMREECGPVYDSYHFQLDDGTGILHVVVSGPCGKPPGTVVPIPEGSIVEVEIQVQTAATDSVQPMVWGVAKSIREISREPRQEGRAQ